MTRSAPCRLLRDRQQKVATAQLGDRDVFGLKIGPSGSAIQVFAMRGGRVIERIELVTDPGGIAVRDADVLQAALPAVLRDAGAARGDRSAARDRGLRGDGGVAVGARRPAHQDPRAAARRQSERSSSWRTRNAELIYAHALQREHGRAFRCARNASNRPRPAGCSPAHRMLRHLDDPGSETVASMVVCEDGRMKSLSIGSFG